ncbi:hypothetical protein HYV85_01270 [Candidatus Woesearchaeota archaeon]|nr:hypothetical protein [Candidatus Woesearchaeota archaeon]
MNADPDPNIEELIEKLRGMAGAGKDSEKLIEELKARLNSYPNPKEVIDTIMAMMNVYPDRANFVGKLRDYKKQVNLQLAEVYETAAQELDVFVPEERLPVRHTKATILKLGSEKLNGLASVVMAALTEMASCAQPHHAEPYEDGTGCYVTIVGATEVSTIMRAHIDAAMNFVNSVKRGIMPPPDYAIEKAQMVLRQMAAIYYERARGTSL